MSLSSSAVVLLKRQLEGMQNEKEDAIGISVGVVDDNILEWEVMLMLDEDLPNYGGGVFGALLTFPPEYPLKPPTMKFKTEIWHPNIYPNGNVCISILHPPEEDPHGYEHISERWSPVQGPWSILLSVISMLGSPNDESPANLDAAKQWREDPVGFRRKCRRCVTASVGL